MEEREHGCHQLPASQLFHGRWQAGRTQYTPSHSSCCRPARPSSAPAQPPPIISPSPLPLLLLQVFTTGTAVVLSPVGSLTYQGERRQFGEPGQPGPVALELYEQLTGLQQEKLEDPFGWVHPVC